MKQSQLTITDTVMSATTRKQAAFIANNRPLIASTKKLKRMQDRLVQRMAFDELLKIRNKNGGVLKYGDLQTIVNSYDIVGFQEVVTCRNLRYRLSILQKKGSVLMPTEVPKPCFGLVWLSESSNISPLSDGGVEERVKKDLGNKITKKTVKIARRTVRSIGNRKKKVHVTHILKGCK